MSGTCAVNMKRSGDLVSSKLFVKRHLPVFSFLFMVYVSKSLYISAPFEVDCFKNRGRHLYGR